MVIRSEAKVKRNPACEASTKFFQPSFQKPMKRFEKKSSICEDVRLAGIITGLLIIPGKEEPVH